MVAIRVFFLSAAECVIRLNDDNDNDGGVAQHGSHALTRNVPAVCSGSMPSFLCRIFKEKKTNGLSFLISGYTKAKTKRKLNRKQELQVKK